MTCVYQGTSVEGRGQLRSVLSIHLVSPRDRTQARDLDKDKHKPFDLLNLKQHFP